MQTTQRRTKKAPVPVVESPIFSRQEQDDIAIEDSDGEVDGNDEDEDGKQNNHQRIPTTKIQQIDEETISGSNSPSPVREHDSDPDLDILFGSVIEHPTKRRRISIGNDMHTPTQTRKHDQNQATSPILSSSSPRGPSSPIEAEAATAIEQSIHSHSGKQEMTIGIGMRRVEPLPPSAIESFPTPGSIYSNMRTPTPFGGRRRFILSQSQSQSQSLLQQRNTYNSNILASPQTPAPTTKQKPTFILPQSPENVTGTGTRTEEFSSLLTPFSPSSRKQRRGGGQPSYVPGGMAAEVRGWILEAAMKQGQLSGNSLGNTGNTMAQPDRNEIVLRVEESRRHTMSSCGLLTFIRGKLVNKNNNNQDECPDELEENEHKNGSIQLNALLLGTPCITKHGLGNEKPLEPHCLIGLRRGLVWEVEFHDNVDHNDYDDHDVVQGTDKGKDRQTCNRDAASRKWLVSVGWDILG